MRVRATIEDGEITLAAWCAECSEEIADSTPVDSLLERLAGGSPLVAGFVQNFLLPMLAGEEGCIELIDSEFDELFALCSDCRVEYGTLKDSVETGAL